MPYSISNFKKVIVVFKTGLVGEYLRATVTDFSIIDVSLIWAKDVQFKIGSTQIKNNFFMGDFRVIKLVKYIEFQNRVAANGLHWRSSGNSLLVLPGADD